MYRHKARSACSFATTCQIFLYFYIVFLSICVIIYSVFFSIFNSDLCSTLFIFTRSGNFTAKNNLYSALHKIVASACGSYDRFICALVPERKHNYARRNYYHDSCLLRSFEDESLTILYHLLYIIYAFVYVRIRMHLYKWMRGFQDPSLTNCYRGGACGFRITKYIIQTHPYLVVSRLGYCRNVQCSYEDSVLRML